MLAAVRRFFFERAVLEVDPPLISSCGSVDAYIDLMSVENSHYLNASPEYPMKRLLASGSGDIYFLGHVFRRGEVGGRHNPEFTMIEWYRTDTTKEAFIQEVVELIALFIGKTNYRTLTYDEAMERYASSTPPKRFSEAEKRHYLFATDVEPHLQELTVITAFPEEEAALAKVSNGKAERFEIYYQTQELANGFFELTDPKEQRRRFEESNRIRISEGKQPYPIDEKLLTALPHLGESTYGVACGFDRLLMLLLGKHQIQEVLPFPWHEI